jgi:hypothetical protein
MQSCYEDLGPRVLNDKFGKLLRNLANCITFSTVQGHKYSLVLQAREWLLGQVCQNICIIFIKSIFPEDGDRSIICPRPLLRKVVQNSIFHPLGIKCITAAS